MIQSESILTVCDNSGALLVKCIKVLSSSKKRYAYLGDLLKISVKKISFNSKLKKGFVCNAVLVRSVYNFKRYDGSFISFFDNSVVLLNDKYENLGTRIFGFIPKELKNNFFLKKNINLFSSLYI